MMSVLLLPLFKSVNLSVIILALFVFGIGAFLGNQHAFKQDVLKTKVATVAALVGFIETGFTFLVLRRIGVITNQTHDFTGIFMILAGYGYIFANNSICFCTGQSGIKSSRNSA